MEIRSPTFWRRWLSASRIGKACPRACGDICENCYAEKGMYMFACVRRALEARFAWVRSSLKTATGRTEFIETMVHAIQDATKWEPYFRIHDSGDFFNVAYVESWIEICRPLPTKKCWVPFRGWQQPTGHGAFRILGAEDKLLSAVRQLASLPNVVVRPSALNFGDPAPVIPGLAAGSSAAEDTHSIPGAYPCPAHLQNGECGSCRHCWDSPEIPVTYHKH